MDLVNSEPAPGVQEELSRFGRRLLRCFQGFGCFDAQDVGKVFACGCQTYSPTGCPAARVLDSFSRRIQAVERLAPVILNPFLVCFVELVSRVELP